MFPTYFGLRPSSGSLQSNLAKVILILKHSVRLRRNLLCIGVAACPSMACVLCAVRSENQNARCNDKKNHIMLFAICLQAQLLLSVLQTQ